MNRGLPFSAAMLFFVILWLSLIVNAAGETTPKPNISYYPERPLLDETINIEVRNLSPNEIVEIQATAMDADQQKFFSSARYRADDSGRIDLSLDAPLSGAYEGVDPMGLFWSVDAAGEQSGVSTFDLPQTGPVAFSLNVWRGASLLTEATIARWQEADGITHEKIDDGEIYGALYYGATDDKLPAVIVLGGSEGGVDSAKLTAKLLASRGYVALALGYFSFDGEGELPNTLQDIPLEYFDSAIKWLARQQRVDKNRISIIGGSKGAEAALLTAAHFSGIRSVIAIAPSSVSWASPFADLDEASWAINGEPLPFVNYRPDPEHLPPEKGPNILAHHYAYSLAQGVPSDAIIPVENISVPVLLISGDDDLIWPSSKMAGEILSRSTDYGVKESGIRHLSFANAGHSFSPAQLPTSWTPGMWRRWPNGGTPEGNAAAQRSAWRGVLEFLNAQNTE